MSEIKVMMFGAARSGKTSILASILRSARQIVTRYGFTLRDVTIEEEKQNSLTYSIHEMQNLLNFQNGRGYARMDALTGTRLIFYYKLKLGYTDFPNVNSTNLTFIDVPGEFFDNRKPQFEDTCKLAKQCQILVVAVDTPALFWAQQKGDFGWDNEVNCTESLIDAVQNLGIDCKRNDEDEPLRMVVFVPVKCERWLHDENSAMHVERIKSQIERVYGDAISIWQNAGLKTKVMMMPMETIGGLEFDHYTPPERMKVLRYNESVRFGPDDKRWEEFTLLFENDTEERYVTRCEMDGEDESVVVLARTGVDYQLKDGDELVSVERLPGYPYCYKPAHPIPFAWFKSTGDYAPKDCEKLFFEIIKFAVQQAADYSNKNINDLINMNIGGGFFGRLVKMFLGRGFFDDKKQLQAMCRAVQRMKCDNVLGTNSVIVHNNIDPVGSILEIN